MSYWTFGGKNGLAGVNGTTEVLSDGRVVTHKDPDNPAIMSDDQIASALQQSRIARAQFVQIFDTLLPEEQERLQNLLDQRPRLKRMLDDDQSISDTIQRNDTTRGVRVPQRAKKV